MPDTASTLDRETGAWVARYSGSHLAPPDRAILQRLATAVSFAVSLKHTCLDLGVCAGLGEPALAELLEGISTQDVQRVVTGAVKPLVASGDGQRLWLQKYHAFELAVARMLESMRAGQRLEIITGGPGTGKTWNAAKRIKEELESNPHCVIKLAAPTGKAANNMMVALANAGLGEIRHAPKGLTLHSLLGMGGRSLQPRHHRLRPLSCDLLVVDEASMIDLPMMYRLLDAMPAHARLLLLGDKDQLASVEAGSVLADICRALDGDRSMRVLDRNYRYQDAPEIADLATALNQGSVPVMAGNRDVIHHVLAGDTPWKPTWLEQAATGYAWIARVLAQDPAVEAILQQQKQFQLLCALRDGPYGVTGINKMVAGALGHKPDSWYPGRPVMVTQNDHDRKLYNGDVGMLLQTGEGVMACFLVNGVVKAISQAQMPAHETCYAMTVHKSQGSEYEHVMIVLPADVKQVEANPVLTRELVYTAVTRARSRINLWAGEGVLEAAACRQSTRMSGLGGHLAAARQPG